MGKLFIPKDEIEAIRSHTRIEDIVSRYVPSLIKKGQNYSGLCPFHKEKTPSFVVFPEKQSYYCFGCHLGGNVFNFVMAVENLSYPESVKFVADLIGYQLKKQDYSEGESDFDLYQRMNNYAQEVYNRYLSSVAGKRGLDYLIGRGVTLETINLFKLGYAPDQWQFLASLLQKNNVVPQKAFEIGLLSESQKKPGRFYDKFRDRIIFPIMDVNKKTIAFSGRIIGDAKPKYLNSPESVLYKKRENLYGLPLAKNAIKEEKKAIIVEGNLDVVGCHQAGIKNVVAPLGTALTLEQVKLLSRYCNEIVLLFDSDAAGVNASMKSLALFENANVDVKVASLTEGDPFDYIKNHSSEEFLAIVNQAIKGIDFALNYISHDDSLNKRQKLFKMFEVIEKIDLASEQDLYLRKIVNFLETTQTGVVADFENFKKNRLKNDHYKFDNKRSEYTEIVEEQPILEVVSPEKKIMNKAYRDLISVICIHPELIENANIDFPIEVVTDKVAANIYEKMIELYRGNEEITLDRLFDFFPGGEEHSFLTNLLKTDLSVDDPLAVYAEIYSNLKISAINERKKKCAAKLASQKLSNAESKEYYTEFQALLKAEAELRKSIYNKKI